MNLKWYNHPAEFYSACASFLEEREMANNMLLGNCLQVIQENRNLEGLYFLSNDPGAEIRNCSIKVSPKIILSCQDSSNVQAFYHFFESNRIDFKGVIGNRSAVEVFLKHCSKRVLQNRITLVQGLDKVNDLHLSQGSFEPARLSDVAQLKKWAGQFLEEENLFPKRSQAETEGFIKGLMKQGNLFSWIQKDKVVSMAAIIRRTKNMAVIGFVYTPEQYRGNGFGKSCVHQLSEYILKSGAKQSGLLVYETNNSARKIYGQIGYKTVDEMLDIDFE